MDTRIIGKHGIITDHTYVSRLLKVLKPYKNRNYNFFRTKVYYYSKVATSINDYTRVATDESQIKIVKYYNTRSFFSSAWCFLFQKVGNDWVGTYVSNHQSLFNFGVARINGNDLPLKLLPLPKVVPSEETLAKGVTSPLARVIYKMLPDTTEWDKVGGSIGIKTYLRQLLFTVRHVVSFAKEIPQSIDFKATSRKTTLVVNTGLVDKSGNYIYIEVTQVSVQQEGLHESIYTIVSAEVVHDYPNQLDVFNVYDCVIPKKFNGSTVKMDYHHGLDHITFSRSYRLSKGSNGKYSKEQLKNSIIKSIELAIQKNKTDENYVVPFLSLRVFKISFLVPLYLDGDETTSPLGAILLTDILAGTWVPATVLDLKTAWSDARLLAPIKAKWLEVNTCV